MKKLISGLAVCLLLTGCTSAPKETDQPTTPSNEEKKTLRVGTSSGYDPYELVDAKGKLIGFDIELMDAIAAKLNYDIEWTDMDFNALVSSVDTGLVDVAAAGLSPDAERAKVVDFSMSYYTADENTTNYILTLADGEVKTVEDIKGKTVGVQIGTIQESTVNEIKAEYELEVDPRTKYADLVQEIKIGGVDLMVCEKAVADGFIEVNPQLVAFPLGIGTESSGNALAFKKDSPLKAEFDAVIQEMSDSGELGKLIEKWFTTVAE